MSLIPVEGNKNLSRDGKTNALINTNKGEFQAYIKNREKLLSDKERVDSLEKKVDNLKGDLDEIKSMLKAVING
jgi:chaperonin cofactor prefoldin|tara:strand:+ start:495 stop:716 length:222 start_codon:yes stop_codon:yes gene_type:complete